MPPFRAGDVYKRQAQQIPGEVFQRRKLFITGQHIISRTHPVILIDLSLIHIYVKLTTRKQDTVVFYVLESYEVYQLRRQAA